MKVQKGKKKIKKMHPLQKKVECWELEKTNEEEEEKEGEKRGENEDITAGQKPTQTMNYSSKIFYLTL